MKKSEVIIKITDTKAQEIKKYLGVFYLGFTDGSQTCYKSTLSKLAKAKREEKERIKDEANLNALIAKIQKAN